ncbi:MAG: HAD family phosphatase [Candidatus Omnitrophica bacterium]|nr:HAD family phosphatase [Candidatus Omnitrophota bacterium]MDD5488259.1 HAD family phosphatase [Candidatus Omnitrophota bacterium]
MGKYKAVVFDIDGTITRHISSWRYMHEKLGLWDALARKYQEQFLAGKISYRRFCELDAGHWKGLEASKVRSIFSRVKYSRNAKRTVSMLREKGFKLVAVSTGIQFMTDRVKEELGFDHVIGNRLNVYRGKLTGGVSINIGHGAKGVTVKKILRRYGCIPEEMIAIGDSEGDIPMIEIAGYSIAFNSSSRTLSGIVDWDCPSHDLMDVYRKIIQISG